MNLKTVSLLAGVASLTSAAVLDLASSSSLFDERVFSGSNVWVVEFYTSWCPHCKRLLPEFEKADAVLSAASAPVRLGKVNCEEKQGGKLCKKFKIYSYPTILAFAPSLADGKQEMTLREPIAKYPKAPRKVNNILLYASSMLSRRRPQEIQNKEEWDRYWDEYHHFEGEQKILTGNNISEATQTSELLRAAFQHSSAFVGTQGVTPTQYMKAAARYVPTFIVRSNELLPGNLSGSDDCCFIPLYNDENDSLHCFDSLNVKTMKEFEKIAQQHYHWKHSYVEPDWNDLYHLRDHDPRKAVVLAVNNMRTDLASMSLVDTLQNRSDILGIIVDKSNEQYKKALEQYGMRGSARDGSTGFLLVFEEAMQTGHVWKTAVNTTAELDSFLDGIRDGSIRSMSDSAATKIVPERASFFGQKFIAIIVGVLVLAAGIALYYWTKPHEAATKHQHYVGSSTKVFKHE